MPSSVENRRPSHEHVHSSSTEKVGVAAGFISGTAVTIIWNLIPTLQNTLYHLVPAFFVSAFLTITISLLTKPPEGAEQELRLISAKYRQ